MAQKHRLRRTMMFIPGNNPGMMRDAHIYGSDSLMFDLEDSVSMAEKDAARPAGAAFSSYYIKVV